MSNAFDILVQNAKKTQKRVQCFSSPVLTDPKSTTSITIPRHNSAHPTTEDTTTFDYNASVRTLKQLRQHMHLASGKRTNTKVPGPPSRSPRNTVPPPLQKENVDDETRSSHVNDSRTPETPKTSDPPPPPSPQNTIKNTEVAIDESNDDFMYEDDEDEKNLRRKSKHKKFYTKKNRAVGVPYSIEPVSRREISEATSHSSQQTVRKLIKDCIKSGNKFLFFSHGDGNTERCENSSICTIAFHGDPDDSIAKIQAGFAWRFADSPVRPDVVPKIATVMGYDKKLCQDPSDPNDPCFVPWPISTCNTGGRKGIPYVDTANIPDPFERHPQDVIRERRHKEMLEELGIREQDTIIGHYQCAQCHYVNPLLEHKVLGKRRYGFFASGDGDGGGGGRGEGRSNINVRGNMTNKGKMKRKRRTKKRKNDPKRQKLTENEPNDESITTDVPPPRHDGVPSVDEMNTSSLIPRRPDGSIDVDSWYKGMDAKGSMPTLLNPGENDSIPPPLSYQDGENNVLNALFHELVDRPMTDPGDATGGDVAVSVISPSDDPSMPSSLPQLLHTSSPHTIYRKQDDGHSGTHLLQQIVPKPKPRIRRNPKVNYPDDEISKHVYSQAATVGKVNKMVTGMQKIQNILKNI